MMMAGVTLPVATLKLVDDDDDDGRINFSVALSPKTTRTLNNKPKQ